MRTGETDVAFFSRRCVPRRLRLSYIAAADVLFVRIELNKTFFFPSCQLFSQLIHNCSPFYDIPRCFACVEDCVTTIHARTWNIPHSENSVSRFHKLYGKVE